jgi:hypothetical protein
MIRIFAPIIRVWRFPPPMISSIGNIEGPSVDTCVSMNRVDTCVSINRVDTCVSINRGTHPVRFPP